MNAEISQFFLPSPMRVAAGQLPVGLSVAVVHADSVRGHRPRAWRDPPSGRGGAFLLHLNAEIRSMRLAALRGWSPPGPTR
jgi:hypothetical protein